MNDTDKSSGRAPLPVRLVRGLYVIVRGYFAIIGLLVTLLPIALFTMASRMETRRTLPDVTADNPARLTLGLTGTIVEKEPSFSERLLSRLFGEEDTLYLPEIRSALRRAQTDTRVAKLDVELGTLSGTIAELTELRRMLVEFREAGKPVTVALVQGDDWNYYVASAADRIVLNPASSLTVPGPVFHLVYFGEALQKLGVELELLRAGRYKSAFEPFVTNTPSEPTLEQYRAMEASLRDHLVEAVAKSRGKSPDVVRGWFARSIFTAEDAVKEGLVDAVGYAATGVPSPAAKEAEDAAADAKTEPLLKLEDYAAAPVDATGAYADKVAGGTDGIALIEAVGEIHMGGAGRADDGITPSGITRQLRWAARDDRVKAVVLRISSPGGSATASDVIWNEVKKLTAIKPVVVSMGAYAASGGYYIAAPAQKLIAEPTTITGSIGVIGAIPRLGGFRDKWGVSFHVVTQSERAALLDLGAGATAEDRRLMEQTIDQVYRTFVGKVAEGRKLPYETVASYAEGRVYTGLQAKELALVDEIGGLTDAFRAAKELAGLDPEKLYPMHHYRGEEVDLSQCLGGPREMLRCLRPGGGALAPDSDALARVLDGGAAVTRTASQVQGWVTRLVDGRETLALWPGYLSLARSR